MAAFFEGDDGFAVGAFAFEGEDGAVAEAVVFDALADLEGGDG